MRSDEARQLSIRAFRVDDVVTVAASLPGFAPEDIAVEVTGKGHIIVDGQPSEDPTAEDFGMLKSDKEILFDEWRPGPVHREIPLNLAVDGSSATVTYRNGILVVALPVARNTRPARLSLESIGHGRGERIPGGR